MFFECGNRLLSRRNEKLSYADAVCYSLMAGFGETYFAAFALAIGIGQVQAGLLSSVPFIAAGLLQLVTPRLLERFKSYRRWVVLCASIQAASHLWFVYAALSGKISLASFFIVCVLYWATGMAGGPVWNAWIESITNKSGFRPFIAVRSRIAQVAAFFAFCAAGFLLEQFKGADKVLTGFAILFGAAAFFRFFSASFLGSQQDFYPEHVSRSKSPWRDLFQMLSDRNSGRFLLFMLVAQVSVYVASPYFSPYMLGHLQLSYYDYVLLIAASFVAKIAVYPIVARLIDRFTALRCLVVSGLCVAPAPLFWFWTPTLPALVASQVFAGCAWAMFELSSTLLIFSNIKSSERIRILTGYNLFNAVCIVTGSCIGGWLLRSGASGETYRLVFTISAICRLLSVMALIGVRNVGHKVRVIAFRTLGLRPSNGSLAAPVLDTRDQSRRND